ncbi:integrase [Kaistia hirudinis]|uniref:Integrase n=1 Tax=Kaistia hirudinis TaxID=1293440 RepID=A0A840APK2_9HYPH|nr:site-specific integrase [Kaistia hirudinis]MBB3931203.1 integrase [Kaistia hirudinis]
MAEPARKITKRVVDAAAPGESRFVVWDSELKGFGLRVEPSGTKTYLVRYRPRDGGRTAAKRFVTIGRHGPLTPDEARARALAILGAVARGEDPAAKIGEAKARPTLQALYDEYDRLHISTKLKPSTASSYRSTFKKHILPAWGARRADSIGRPDILRFHAGLTDHRVTANRALAILSGMFEWAAGNGYLPEGSNPISGVARYREQSRERFLDLDELERFGAALREAETIGIPWQVDEAKAKAKHAPKPENRRTLISPYAAGALRLLLFTGARLREVLHMRWEWIDFQRGIATLPDSKTGKRSIYLNPPALAVLASLPRQGKFIFPAEREARDIDGGPEEKPRHDLKRAWNAVRRMAQLDNVRIHDLRHTHASFGAASNLGLQTIGQLLGHAQHKTTLRYAHLSADPLRRASEAIGAQLAEALGEGAAAAPSGEVIPFGRSRETG